MNRSQLPFTAIVGQERMRQALVLNISPLNPLLRSSKKTAMDPIPGRAFKAVCADARARFTHGATYAREISF
jgi:hypothetical protein